MMMGSRVLVIILLYSICATVTGYNDIGFHNPEVLTPCLNELARNGMILESSYVSNVCTPTRHSVMTGRYPHRDKMGHFVLFGNKFCLPTNIKLLPERLKELKYKTIMSGKWHLGHCQKACLPTQRGFDKFFGLYDGAADFFTHVGFGFDWWKQEDPYYEADGIYSTFLINDFIVDEIEQHNGKDPLFAYISHPAPHMPLQVPQRFEDLYPNLEGNRKTLLGMISAIDESVCNVTMALERKNLLDNTLFIFSSVNGGEFGDFASNLPLRAGKYSLFEGGIRTAAFVSGPMIPKGVVNKGMIHATDWVPTIMNYLGESTDDEDLDGIDQNAMIFDDGESDRREVVYNLDMHPNRIFGQAAVRRDEFKLIWGHTGMSVGRGNTTLINRNLDTYEQLMLNPGQTLDVLPDTFVSNFRGFSMAVHTAFSQLVGFREDDITSGQVHLFNIKEDPNEMNNLAYDPCYANKVLELKNMILDEIRRHKIITFEEGLELPTDQLYIPVPQNDAGLLRTGFCEGAALTV